MEDHDRIYGLERSQNFGTFVLRNCRATGSFKLSHRLISIETDNQDVSMAFRGLKELDVAGVQHVEAAICENDAASVAFLAAKLQNRFVQRQYRRMTQGISQQEKRGMTANSETLVYHAGKIGAECPIPRTI